jgi:hypothetical protein
MYRQIDGVQGYLRGLIPTVLLMFGCAPGTAEPPRPPTSVGPVVEHGVGDDRYAALEALPSAAAAELLPVDARYRVVLGVEGTLALVIVGPDQRILGRLHIATKARPWAIVGTRVDYEDVGGRATRVEAWSSAGSIDGQALVGDRSARFRVRLGADGSLAGERWSLAHADHSSPELLELRRARAIGADLGALATQLSSVGAFAKYDRCELGELVALAGLALDLSVRAWAGEGRARLPGVGEYVASDQLCGL